MSHGDRIEAMPPNWKALAQSGNSPFAAMGDPARGAYGLQFHPEVTHTPRARPSYAPLPWTSVAPRPTGRRPISSPRA